MTIPITIETLHFIETCEGCRLKAYKDSRGIWTIGVGLTQLNGRPVKSTDSITQSQADSLFKVTAQSFQDRVLQLVKHPEKLKPNQITALTSLAYNIGLGAFSTSSVLKYVNLGNMTSAANAFLNWTRAGNDKYILLPRRKKERELFMK
jgi:lysozyme